MTQPSHNSLNPGFDSVFIDDGLPGFWRDMLANSPLLEAGDYAGCERADALALPPSLSFHEAGDTP